MEWYWHTPITIKLESFSGLENFNNYNGFFYPNACHVCKTTIQENLKSCSECHMIAYCSEEHKTLHRPQHYEVCQAIGKLSKEKNLWDTRGLTSNKWIIFKKKNVASIRKKLRRKLKPYEKEMFMFAKSCLICHQQTNLVTTCKNCCCVNVCADHNLDNVEHDCVGLLFSFVLDIEYFTQEQYIMYKLFNSKIRMTQFPVNIASFVTTFDTDDMYNYRFWKPFDYYFCDWVSEPLTVCQIIQDPLYSYLAHKSPFFIVHIITNSNITNNWLVWELLLHMLADKVALRIIVLGPELLNSHMLTHVLNLCETCTRLGKSLSIRWSNIYEYYMPTSLHDQPDLIVGFHVKLRKFEKEIIEAIDYQKCPLILTAESKNKADNNIKQLHTILGTFKTSSIIIKNKFKSLRSYRNYENGCIFLRNEFLIIYDKSIYFQQFSSR